MLAMSADSVATGAQQQRFADYLHRLAQAAGHRDRASPLKLYCNRQSLIKCLDLGCGSGYAMRALRSAGYSDVRGIDVSSQAAGLARKAGFQVLCKQIFENTSGSAVSTTT